MSFSTVIRKFFTKHYSRVRFTISLLLAICSLLPILSFAQMEWTCVTPSAGWALREFHSAVAFDNKLWLLGGHSDTNFYNDVWYSRGLGIQEGSMLDASRSMTKIYPNPFKTSTEITYNRSKLTTARISIYNSMGKEVKLIFNGKQNADLHKAHWNGQDNSGRILPAGIYFIRLESTGHKKIRKIIRL